MSQQTANVRLSSIWSIAIPSMIANITIPLIGIADIAVIGHTQTVSALSAIGIATNFFNIILLIFIFLKMSTTGLVAQASGNIHSGEQDAWLIRSALFGLIASVFILIGKDSITTLAMQIFNPSKEIEGIAADYISIRFLSLPATLLNLAIGGWLLGQGKIKYALCIQCLISIINITLDILLVYYFDYGVAGVASATVIAEYTALIIGGLLFKKLKNNNILFLFQKSKQLSKYKTLIKLNGNIFIRSICLQISFFYFTYKSLSLGNEYLAANVILLNFVMLASYIYDGLSNAAEILCGRCIGVKDDVSLRLTVTRLIKATLFFSSLLFTIYILGKDNFIAAHTALSDIITLCNQYSLWAIIISTVAGLSFLFDGIFIGATYGKALRNSMIISSVTFILTGHYLSQQFHNNGLWAGFLIFMILRGIVLALYYPSLLKEN